MSEPQRSIAVAIHAMAEENRRLREALEAARVSHHGCEDTWYSCPKHSDGCADNRYSENECNCGADKHNAAIDTALQSPTVNRESE